MTLTSTAITLILVMDPLGNVPMFLSILNHVQPTKRRAIILREAFIAFIVMVLFLLFGQLMLNDMHISSPALSISGGIILFIIAIRMIFPTPDAVKLTRTDLEPFIVPLAVPLIAGPSTLTMVILLANQTPDRIPHLFVAVMIACAVSTLILVFAENFRKVLGERGLIAVERLMGMILTTLAVQMFLNGFSEFLHTA